MIKVLGGNKRHYYQLRRRNANSWGSLPSDNPQALGPLLLFLQLLGSPLLSYQVQSPPNSSLSGIKQPEENKRKLLLTYAEEEI